MAFKDDHDENFRKEIVQTVRDGITNLWGSDVADVIFYNFSRDNKLAGEEIANNPRLFETTLEKIFGEMGSRSVISVIVKEIIVHFKISEEEQLSDIEHAIRIARMTFNKSQDGFWKSV